VLRALILAAVAAIGLAPFTGFAAPEPPRDVLVWSEKQLDGYYRTQFALAGMEYESPRTLYKRPFEALYTACGTVPKEATMVAFYCPADQTIVMSDDVIEWAEKTDDFVPAYILSHEWAHHAQHLAGSVPVYVPGEGDWNQVYTIENELRADCMAGAWMGNISDRGYLDSTDIPGVLVMASQIGGPGLYGRTTSHGTGLERLQAVFTGYEHGQIGCMSITPLPRMGI
jgi:predicted metalloprotease